MSYGNPLITNNNFDSTGPIVLDSIKLPLYKGGSTSTVNTTYNFKVDLYKYSAGNIDTSGTSANRTFAPTLSNADIAASTTFNIAASALTTGAVLTTFSKTTPNQSSTPKSIFDLALDPSSAYFVVFSNPAATGGSGGINTGGGSSNTLLTRGLPGAITNGTTSPYLAWNNTANTTSCSANPEPLADAITCRYSTINYGATTTVNTQQSYLEITASKYIDPAPAPLPVLGGVIAFSASRRIRNRIKMAAV